jgi:hypothetical protein
LNTTNHRKWISYKEITKKFEIKILELKTPPKKDMRFARLPDRNEFARNSESAWQIFLLWREICSEYLSNEDENRLMQLATMGDYDDTNTSGL